MSRREMIFNFEFQNKVRRPSLYPVLALYANIDRGEVEKNSNLSLFVVQPIFRKRKKGLFWRLMARPARRNWLRMKLGEYHRKERMSALI